MPKLTLANLTQSLANRRAQNARRFKDTAQAIADGTPEVSLDEAVKILDETDNQPSELLAVANRRAARNAARETIAQASTVVSAANVKLTAMQTELDSITAKRTAILAQMTAARGQLELYGKNAIEARQTLEDTAPHELHTQRAQLVQTMHSISGKIQQHNTDAARTEAWHSVPDPQNASNYNVARHVVADGTIFNTSEIPPIALGKFINARAKKELPLLLSKFAQLGTSINEIDKQILAAD